MRRVEVVVVALVLLVVGGLVVVLVGLMREVQGHEQCRNNLGQIGLGLLHYEEDKKHFPPGTVPNPDLSPDRRLSWYVEAWDNVSSEMSELILDREAAWDAADNLQPKRRLRLLLTTQCVAGDPKWVNCPSSPGTPGLAHYVGVAGVGDDAALLTVEDKRAGVFGYDRKTRLEDIKDGTGTTLLVIETARDNGPWTAGGRATVRGLEVGGTPYLGRGGQFSSGHRGVTNAAFVDGSVRSLREGIDPAVFEALATIAGNEQVGRVGDE